MVNNINVMIATISFCVNEYLQLDKHPIHHMHYAKLYKDESHKFEIPFDRVFGKLSDFVLSIIKPRNILQTYKIEVIHYII